MKKIFENGKEGIEFENEEEAILFAESMLDVAEFVKEEFCTSKSINLEKEIEKVTFSDPATIVFWKDGTKTVTKCHNGDTFNKETGLAMCIVRKLCNNRNYNKVFEKFCGTTNK